MSYVSDITQNACSFDSCMDLVESTFYYATNVVEFIKHRDYKKNFRMFINLILGFYRNTIWLPFYCSCCNLWKVETFILHRCSLEGTFPIKK